MKQRVICRINLNVNTFNLNKENKMTLIDFDFSHAVHPQVSPLAQSGISHN